MHILCKAKPDILVFVTLAEKQGKKLENVTLDCSSHADSGEPQLLSQLFDLSLLRFQQRDDVAETFRKYGRKVGQPPNFLEL